MITQTNTQGSTKKSKLIRQLAIVGCAAFMGSQLAGCTAIGTAIQHRNLETESKMSQTIFLDPVSQKDKTIYVQVRDTSGQDVNLKDALIACLKGQGWKVVNDVDQAHDMVQVNVLQVGKAPNQQSVWQSMNSGFGNAILGGFAGVATGLATDSVAAGMGVGAATGAIGWLADQMVKDVTYSMITDIQVSVRVNGEVTQTTKASLAQGSSTATTQTYHQKTNWLRYRARIASIADQVNLDFEDAKPTLISETTKEIAGIFGA
ncbi:complement resistance protein TraT [Fangia hongkongensis]|uniref:complement resistance protein TraT n=1 Tax=Fangia hongkongensis TaxID=270495 RepID=UPI00037182CD|nr:complement resistance protein TraT [Fangia hongkongensis]MBK2125049.1 complement resistance protein TraT [Fangia hongkongensis]